MFQSTRKQSTFSNLSDTSNGLTKRIEQLQKAGEIGAIVKLINQSSQRLQVDNDIIQKFQAKHPAPVSPVPDEFKNIVPSNISADLNITPAALRQIIFRRAKLKSPGLDKFRFDHLRPLIGNGNSTAPDENQFAEYLVKIVSLIIDGKAPNSIFSLLRDNVMVGIPKDNNDVRPIGMGITVRKLASIFLLKYTSIATSATLQGQDEPFNSSHFKDLQYGLTSLGTENIIHSLRLRHELHPEEDIFTPDADNAFNTAS